MARLSIESEDRLQLLSDKASIAAPSISSTVRPSEHGETSSNAVTPRPSVDSLRRVTVPLVSSASTLNEPEPTQMPKSYRGFPSEEAYLAALRSWVEEKQHLRLDTSMVGWYGTRTSQDYINSRAAPIGLRTKLRERKAERQRRHTIENINDMTPSCVKNDSGSTNEEERSDDHHTDNTIESTEVDGPSRKRFVWPRRKGVGLTTSRTR